MAAIVWNRSFSVGIRRMDHQHRKIVTILNQLYELDRARERQQLARVFAMLRDYLLAHFADEEALMRRHQFPGILEHQQEHARFVDAVCDFHREFLKGRRFALINLYNAIWDWLVGHVLIDDRSVGAWCRGAEQPGPQPAAVAAIPGTVAAR